MFFHYTWSTLIDALERIGIKRQPDGSDALILEGTDGRDIFYMDLNGDAPRGYQHFADTVRVVVRGNGGGDDILVNGVGSKFGLKYFQVYGETGNGREGNAPVGNPMLFGDDKFHMTAANIKYNRWVTGPSTDDRFSPDKDQGDKVWIHGGGDQFVFNKQVAKVSVDPFEDEIFFAHSEGIRVLSAKLRDINGEGGIQKVVEVQFEGQNDVDDDPETRDFLDGQIIIVQFAERFGRPGTADNDVTWVPGAKVPGIHIATGGGTVREEMAALERLLDDMDTPGGKYPDMFL